MIKKLICALVALGSGFVLLGADSAFVGTWKMNVAKSKFAKGMGTSSDHLTLVVAVENGIGNVHESGTMNGQAYSTTYSAPMTGGPISYTEGGPPAGVTDVLKSIDARTDEIISTMNGKQVTKIHIVISPNHKTMTNTVSGVDEKGQAFRGVYVYDRQ